MFAKKFSLTNHIVGVSAIVLCTIVGCLSAGWWRTYGEGTGICLIQTDDEGYIITGGGWLLIKLNERGDIEWKCKQDTIGYVTCVQQLPDGGYILVTSHNYCVGGKLIKTDKQGNILWTSYIGWGANWVEHTSDGGFVVVGEKYHQLSSYPEDWCTTFELLKTDSSGNILWNRSFGPLVTWSFSGGLCVDEASDSCYVAVGYYGGESWYWLIKTDPSGNLLWERQDSYLSAGITVEQTKDGGYIVGGSDCSLWKTDSLGNKIWRNVYEGYTGWSGPSVQQTPDGSYIMVARTPATDSTNGGDLLLIKVDSVGNTLWSRTYGEGGWDGGNAVRITKDSGYAALGWLSSSDNKTHYIYLLKTDSLGRIHFGVSPIEVYEPKEGYAIGSMKPSAQFFNTDTLPYNQPFFCYCDIYDLGLDSLDYRDSVMVESLGVQESIDIKFAQWTAKGITNYKALFYTVGAGECDTMIVEFRWTGIEEIPISIPGSGWRVAQSIGRTITLCAPEGSANLDLTVFDASGRMVDELILDGSATITWGEGYGPGVYFIRESSGKTPLTCKVILVK